MQTVRQIIEDAPAFIPIPADFQHRRIELIIRPLGDEAETPPSAPPPASFYELAESFAGCVDSGLGDLSTNPRHLDGFGE